MTVALGLGVVDGAADDVSELDVDAEDDPPGGLAAELSLLPALEQPMRDAMAITAAQPKAPARAIRRLRPRSKVLT